MVAEAPTLDTDRLVSRAMTRADVPAVAALANDAEVATRTASIPYPYSVKDAASWFERHRAAGQDGSGLVFALERRSDSEFLGALGLIIGSEDEPVEIGYWLGRPHWNRGCMTEAIRRIIAFAFKEFGFPAVRAAAFPDTAASICVQEKVGTGLVGREVQPAPARGGDREVEVREISREAWGA